MINWVKYNSLIKIGSGFFSGYRGKVTGYEIPPLVKHDIFKPTIFRVMLRESYTWLWQTPRYDWCQTVPVHIMDIESIITEEEMNLLERPIEDPDVERRRRREMETANEQLIERHRATYRRSPYWVWVEELRNVYIDEAVPQPWQVLWGFNYYYDADAWAVTARNTPTYTATWQTDSIAWLQWGV